MRRRPVAILALTALAAPLALAWFGCAKRGAGRDGAGGGRTPGELRVALQSDGKTLDPHRATDAASMRLIENMYETLTRYTPEYGEVGPGLAERYEESADHLTYTFHLRPGARFHGGRAVTAEDVGYSVGRIRSGEVRAEQFAAVGRIDTPDPQTVVFHMTEPSAPLLTYLAYPMNAIVDREVVEAHAGSLDDADGGSGPFRLVEWKVDDHLTLERDPGGTGDPAPTTGPIGHLDGRLVRRVVFLPMPDQAARSTSLRNHEVDLVLDVAAKDLPLIEKAGGMAVDSVPGTFWEYIGLNTSRKPFDDVRVRQAVACAVDREAINRVVHLGRATVLDGGPIPKTHWAYADLHLYPGRDLEKARQLLAAAGYGGGFSAVIKVGSAFPYQVAAAQMVKQQLKDLGIRLEIQAQESGVLFDALGRRDFDLTVCGWVGFVDPDEWTFNLFHTGAKWNQQGYSNPAVDALLQRGRTTFDRGRRKAIYRDVQQLVAEEAPMVFLYLNEQTSARSQLVHGYIVHPTATTIFLRDTRLAGTAEGEMLNAQ